MSDLINRQGIRYEKMLRPCGDGNYEYCDIAYKDEIEALPSAQAWIPVSERLPEEYGKYLVTMKSGLVKEATYKPKRIYVNFREGWSACYADGLFYHDDSEIVAWMPLPEPYKEDKDE